MGLSGGDRSPRESLKNQDTQALRAPPSVWILIQHKSGVLLGTSVILSFRQMSPRESI